MLATLACLLASQVSVDQPPRLRTILPNGAAIIVEKNSVAKSLSLQMFVSSRGTEETPITNGLRHLLEHLLAKGPKGDLDKRLEAGGGFLTAETSRDVMAFRLNLPPGKLDFGVKTLTELMRMPEVTPEVIRKEASIIEQEIALRDDSTKFSAAGWFQAYGDHGLDPVGNVDVIRNATTGMLDSLHKSQFVGPNVVVSVVGDVDLDSATRVCTGFLAALPKSEPHAQERKPGVAGQASVDVPGLAYCLPVPGMRIPETAAKLAAAFAIGSELDHCFVTYTPSGYPGLITLGSLEDSNALSRAVANAKANELFNRGKALAKLWLARMLNSPEHIASSRGLFLANALDLKPEVLLENIKAITPAQFATALNAFKSTDLVMVTGR